MTNVTMAFRSLREGWRRALLSALGILVGCTAIVLLVSIATGVEQDVRSQVEDLGVNVLVVVPGRIDDGSFNPNFGGASYLKEIDATNIARVPGVVRTAPFTFVGGGIRAGKKTAAPLLAATSAEWFRMRPLTMREGRTFTKEEEDEDVVVLGGIAKDALFGKGAVATGKTVTVNKREYRVVGVTEDKKQEQSLLSAGSLQNLVYLPYARLKAKEPDLQTDRVMIQAAPDSDPKALIKAVDTILGERLDRQQFQVLTQEDLLGLVFKLMGILKWLLTGLTSIALFVGGVGILTVMLMSVNERTAEIGIRKAVGARGRDIFSQFLTESVALAVLGAAGGLVLSAVVAQVLRVYTPVKPLITPAIVALAIGVCVGVGALFGLIPAVKAARRPPVEALAGP